MEGERREGGREERRKQGRKKREGRKGKRKRKSLPVIFFLIPSTSPFRGGGHGSLLQYSCLENLMDRGAWWDRVHGVAKSWSQLKQLSMHASILPLFCCSGTKSCPTLSDPMDCSPPSSSVHGVPQARILEWVANPFSRQSSQTRNRDHIFHWATT